MDTQKTHTPVAPAPPLPPEEGHLPVKHLSPQPPSPPPSEEKTRTKDKNLAPSSTSRAAREAASSDSKQTSGHSAKRKSRFSPEQRESPSTNSSNNHDPTHENRRHDKQRSYKSANQWENTSFVGDREGERRKKFLRLMGLAKSTKIEAIPDQPTQSSHDAEKRQRMLKDMESQYEKSRQRHPQLGRKSGW